MPLKLTPTSPSGAVLKSTIENAEHIIHVLLDAVQDNGTGELRVELAGTNVSPFGDIATAENTPILQLDFVYGINTQTGVSTTANSATVDTSAGRLRLQCGTNAAGSAIFNSRRIAKYRPGQGVTARFTPVFAPGVAGNTQIIGMGNVNDGYFFGYNGTSFGLMHRNRGVDSWVPQTGWNTDKCDGTGRSGFTWNPQLGSPVMIRYPYLGYGDVKFYVQNSEDGYWVLCHILKYSNSSDATQVGNPSLFFYARNLNAGNVSNRIMYCGSVGVFLHGRKELVSPKWAANNNKSGITAETNILSIRNATTYNGITNRALVRLTSLSISSSAASGIGIFRMRLGATVGGAPSFTPINGVTADNGVTITSGNSVASVDVAGTTATAGLLIFNATVDNPNTEIVDLLPYEIFLAPGETLTISGESTIASALGVALNWSEDL